MDKILLQYFSKTDFVLWLTVQNRQKTAILKPKPPNIFFDGFGFEFLIPSSPKPKSSNVHSYLKESILIVGTRTTIFRELLFFF